MAVPMVSMPRAWSNKKKTERLRRDAFESLQRMLNRAVADTGVNFSIWSALRTHADQVAIFKQNYTRVNRGRKHSTDRGYAGSIWARKAGGVSVASPDLGSNHQDGLAIDIHPAAIQNWVKANGLTYGFSWDEGRRVGESWHFRYIPSRDAMKSEGVLDHAAVQKVVGAEVDGKIGTGTIALIKAWQKKNGLTADGKVGSTTKRAMGLGKGDAPVVVSPGSKPKPKPVEAATDYKVERHQTKNLRVNRVDTKRGLTGSLKAITIHHWGSDGQKFANVVSWLVADGNGNNQSSAHEVIEDGRVAILADAKDGTWNSGSSQGNLDNYALECRPEATAGDIATVAARVAAIRAEHGDLPLDVHADYVATACPGRYKDLIAEIDTLARGGTVNLGRPVVTPSKPKGLVEDGRWGTTTTKALQRFLNSRVKTRKLAIDGRMGPNAWKSLQDYLGHPVIDGLIENQSYKPDELGNGISPNGWEYTGRNSKGSKTIKRLQRWIGVTQDGVIYEGTTRALQDKLNQHGMG